MFEVLANCKHKIIRKKEKGNEFFILSCYRRRNSRKTEDKVLTFLILPEKMLK